MSLREAAKIYAVSTYTLRRRIASGDLPAVKLGYKLIRVRIEGLNKSKCGSASGETACPRRKPAWCHRC